MDLPLIYWTQRSLSFSAAQRRGSRHDQPAYAVSSPSCQPVGEIQEAGGITADAGTKSWQQSAGTGEEEAHVRRAPSWQAFHKY